MSSVDWMVCSYQRKGSLSFMVFDIESFYLSITESLFTNTIQFVQEITKISDYHMSLINQSQKALLVNEKIPWV